MKILGPADILHHDWCISDLDPKLQISLLTRKHLERAMERVWNPLTTVCKMNVLVMLGRILCDTTSIKGLGCLVFLSLSGIV